MTHPGTSPSRRLFLASFMALGGAAWTVRGAFAEALALSKTPRLTEGPFYPSKLPLDTDNDLVIIKDSITPAVGEITHLTGRVLSTAGEPIKNAVVEIWQCDAKAHYIAQGKGGDKHFQGFGKFETNAKGEYRFRTIKPVPYPGRTPHIHFHVKKGGKILLTSQIFIAGHAGNARDGVLRGAGGLLERELVMADFKKMKDSKIGELSAKFDMVVGVTPERR
jgi:protocatechuate 3,4-dioxygenase beta subunit